MEKLYFQVQGSRGNSYKVTFEGTGENLQAFCTCPAGTQRGQFCKHIAAVLKGEMKAIIEGSEQLSELQKRSQGSPLIAKAKIHKASPPKPEQINLGDIKTLKDLSDYVIKNLDRPNCWCEYSEEDNEARYVTIYEQRYFKNGKPHKHPDELLQISYEPFQTILKVNEDTGEYEESDPVRKVMPFRVENSNFGKFSSAVSKFLVKFDALFANKQDTDGK